MSASAKALWHVVRAARINKGATWPTVYSEAKITHGTMARLAKGIEAPAEQDARLWTWAIANLPKGVGRPRIFKVAA